RRFHPAQQQPDHGRLERDRKKPHYSGLGAEGLRPGLPRSVSHLRRVTRRPDGFTCRQNSSRASALLHAPGFFDYRRIRVRPHRTDRVRAGGPPALQDHRLTQSEELHRAGDQRGLRQMGRVSGRWPAGDGAPRPPGRKSNHPQDQRQDLPYPSGQRRGQSSLREEAVSFFPISAPTAGQSVTPHLAPSRPPNWYPFSPPPTIESAFSIVEHVCRNVKRWHGSDQRERWVGSGLLVAEKQFRRVQGYKQIPALIKELEAQAP